MCKFKATFAAEEPWQGPDCPEQQSRNRRGLPCRLWVPSTVHLGGVSFRFNFYLFIWLHQVLVIARGISDL